MWYVRLLVMIFLVAASLLASAENNGRPPHSYSYSLMDSQSTDTWRLQWNSEDDEDGLGIGSDNEMPQFSAQSEEISSRTEAVDTDDHGASRDGDHRESDDDEEEEFDTNDYAWEFGTTEPSSHVCVDIFCARIGMTVAYHEDGQRALFDSDSEPTPEECCSWL